MIQNSTPLQQVFNIKAVAILIIMILYFLPSTGFSEPLSSKYIINSGPKKYFSEPFSKNYIPNESISLQFTKNIYNITSKISLISDNDKKLMFDQSFIEFKNKNKKFGIGKINRNWSFSPITSLILSNNARPTNSIYYVYDQKQKSKNLLTSWAGPMSFEVFNSFPSSTTKVSNSMLLGMRAVIEPVQNLKFELVKTSQWAGDGQQQGLSSLKAAIIGNTNEKQNSNINQVAGFGISFVSNIQQTQSRFYAQLIGEDESGNLPSCYMYLIGSEFEFSKNKIFSKLGFEFIDTRIDLTRNNNCGPNTAYNNNTYSYTNYGVNLGTSIDTESKLFHLWASKKLSEKFNINYSIQDITINDHNWSEHRLSSSKKNGIQANISPIFKTKSVIINSVLSFRNFSLDKAKIKKGLQLNTSIQYIF